MKANKTTGTMLVATGLVVSMAAQALAGPDTVEARATWAYAPLALALVLHSMPKADGSRFTMALRGLGFGLGAAALAMSFKHSADWAALQGFGVWAWLWPVTVDGFIAYGIGLREYADRVTAEQAESGPLVASEPLESPATAVHPRRDVEAVSEAPTRLRAVPEPVSPGSYRTAVAAVLAGTPGASDDEVADRVGCSAKTVARWRKRLEDGTPAREVV